MSDDLIERLRMCILHLDAAIKCIEAQAAEIERLREEELTGSLERALKWAETITPEEKSAMLKAQRESWVRGEMAMGNDADERKWKALQAENARLREALEAIRQKDCVSFEYLSPLSQATGDRHLRQATRDGPCGKIARAALENKP